MPSQHAIFACWFSHFVLGAWLTLAHGMLDCPRMNDTAHATMPAPATLAPALSYSVVDRQTGATVGKPHTTRAGASRKVDRLDNAWGGYRYTVRPNYA